MRRGGTRQIGGFGLILESCKLRRHFDGHRLRRFVYIKRCVGIQLVCGILPLIVRILNRKSHRISVRGYVQIFAVALRRRNRRYSDGRFTVDKVLRQKAATAQIDKVFCGISRSRIDFSSENGIRGNSFRCYVQKQRKARESLGRNVCGRIVGHSYYAIFSHAEFARSSCGVCVSISVETVIPKSEVYCVVDFDAAADGSQRHSDFAVCKRLFEFAVLHSFRRRLFALIRQTHVQFALVDGYRISENIVGSR